MGNSWINSCQLIQKYCKERNSKTLTAGLLRILSNLDSLNDREKIKEKHSNRYQQLDSLAMYLDFLIRDRDGVLNPIKKKYGASKSTIQKADRYIYNKSRPLKKSYFGKRGDNLKAGQWDGDRGRELAHKKKRSK
jgi:hypothetical protein